MPFRATQDERVIVKSSDKTWSTGGGNGKPLQYACCKSLRNTMKRQKYMTTEDAPPQVGMCPISTGEEPRAISNSSRKNDVAGAKQK